MKASLLIPILAVITFLCGCQANFAPKPLLQKVLVLPYADLVMDPSQPWLDGHAETTHVVIHYGQPERVLRAKYSAEGYRFATVQRALFHVGRRAHQLPKGSPEKARVQATYATLRAFDNDRRTAASAVPPFTGRSSSRRMTMTY